MKDRNGERGLASAEAIVSLPAMAALLFGILHLYGVCAAAIETRAQSRQRAWVLRDATQCARGGVDLRSNGASGFPGLVADKVPGGLGGMFSYGRARGEASRAVRLPPLAAGEATERRIHARAVVTCNEPDHGGLADALLGILRHVSGL